VVGLQAELLNRPSPLPPELKNSVLPVDLPDGITPPEIDHLSAPPSITAPLFGISGLRGLKIEEKEGALRVPTLLRWGDQLLPSLQLASLLTAANVSPDEIFFEPPGILRLGREGPVLRIDSEGFTWLDDSAATMQSASKLQIYPEQAETIKIIRPDEPPRQSEHLASQLRQGLSQKPETTKRYHRWPLLVEIAFLILPALVLTTRRPWLALPLLVPGPLLAPWFSHWLLLTPFLVLGLGGLILRAVFGQRKSRSWRRRG
jgi:hypothetical protein